MRKFCTLFCLCVSLIFSHNNYCQNSKNEKNHFQQVDINNINARLNSWGDHFQDFSMFNSSFEVPKNSGKHTINAFGLWVGGLDHNGQLSLSGQTYRNFGTDFHAGPLSTDGLAQTDEEHAAIWDRIWKVKKSEIDLHKILWNDPFYDVPTDILEWPAHGDTSFNHPYYIAPFFDKNSDGIYTSMDGDYPKIKGDVTYYCVYNDNTDINTQSGGSPLGIEVQSMIYAFDCMQDSAFKNSIFANLKIINRSAEYYEDAYVGLFIDFNIGNKYDDYIGCDTLLNYAFGYNGLDIDDIYGEYPPAQALCVLNDTMDGFMYFSNYSYANDPGYAQRYYKYLRNRWLDDTPLVANGNGHIVSGPGDTTKFAFPGFPSSNSKGWSEVNVGSPPGERKGLMIFGPFTIYPEWEKEYDLAFVYARETDFIWGNTATLTLLNQRIASIKEYYENDSTPCGGQWSAIHLKPTETPAIKIFPNPAINYLTIETDHRFFNAGFKIVDINGTVVMQGKIDKKTSIIDVKKLTRGIFILQLSKNWDIESFRFVKQ